MGTKYYNRWIIWQQWIITTKEIKGRITITFQKAFNKKEFSTGEKLLNVQLGFKIRCFIGAQQN